MGAPIWPQISQNRCFDGQLTLGEGGNYHVDSGFVVRKILARGVMVPWNEGQIVNLDQFPSVGRYLQNDHIFQSYIETLVRVKKS